LSEFSLVVRAELLKRIVSAVTVVVEEARVRLSPEGMQITAIDPGIVMLVHVDMRTSDFYKFKVEDTFEIGLDFSRLADFLKALNKDEQVSIESNNSKIRFAGDIMRYSLKAIDPSALRKRPKLPELQFSAKVEMGPVDFARAIAICDRFSNKVGLSVRDGAFLIHTVGDVDDLSFEFTKLHAVIDGEAESLFSLEYLQPIAKVVSKFDQLKINLGTNTPLALKAAEPSVEFYVAPRIEEV
jgi:proliferating cell nuclear antigen